VKEKPVKRNLWKKPALVFSASCLAAMIMLSPWWVRFFAGDDDVEKAPPVQTILATGNPQPDKTQSAVSAQPENLQPVIDIDQATQAGQAKQPAGPFAYPDDASGAALGQKLPPAAQNKLPGFPPSKPLPRVVPPAIKSPSPALALPPFPLPKLPPSSTLAAARPAAVPEEMPLADYNAVPPVPEIKKLDVNPAVSVPSLDVNKPPVLVQIKLPTPDTAPLTDPTHDASNQAALQGTPPPRTDAAPFLRLSLPDPFANRKGTDLFEPVPEENLPITATPGVPGP
jgi:hypothetical protein